MDNPWGQRQVGEDRAAEVALTEAHTFYNIQKGNEWNETVGFIRVEDITTSTIDMSLIYPI
jgi:hypothetical protein